MMFTGHQGSGSQMGEYREDERLGLLDHHLHVIVCQKNLVVSLG